MEWDLQVHANGVQLLDYFTGRRPWRQLYDFINRLPAWGEYKSQLAMDEEYARILLDKEEEGEETPPGLESDRTPHGYTDIVSRLELIADRVMAVRSAIYASMDQKNHKEPEWERMPTPITAVDREREDRTRKLLYDLDSLVRGGLPLNL